MPDATAKAYLGDSVYVEVDGGMLKLTTDNGFGPSNTIYLEAAVYHALTQYVSQACVLDAKTMNIKPNQPRRKQHVSDDSEKNHQ